MTKPDPTEHNPYYTKYVALVGDDHPLQALRAGCESVLGILAQVDESESLKLHPPYTWTVKEVVGHLMDAERIFAYRALRIARDDTTPLPGFEENNYVKAGKFNRLPLAQLAAEYKAVRDATLALYEGLDEEALSRQGSANGSEISVRALAFILAGHERHHGSIIKKRLGLS